MSKLVLFILVLLVAVSMVACNPGDMGGVMTGGNGVNSVVTAAYCGAHDGHSSNLPNIYHDDNVCQ
jgi:uncharacterized lipoprotein YehR (DUF1307 family)